MSSITNPIQFVSYVENDVAYGDLDTTFKSNLEFQKLEITRYCDACEWKIYSFDDRKVLVLVTIFDSGFSVSFDFVRTKSSWQLVMIEDEST